MSGSIDTPYNLTIGTDHARSIAFCDGQGRIVHAEGPPLPLYSVTKPIIASRIFACGIDIDHTLDHWFCNALLPRACDIRVAHLLTHTSGIRDYGTLPAYNQAIAQGQPPWSDDRFADATLRQPLLFEPGQGWTYSNPGYWLLKRILELETGSSFDELISTFAGAEGLTSLRVTHGVFSDVLPRYPAEWVWHGLLVATAEDAARFIASPTAESLLQRLVAVPGQQAGWRAPHYACGLMVEPGSHWGHSGGGPGYSAACFRFPERAQTGCVLLRSDREDDAYRTLLAWINESTR